MSTPTYQTIDTSALAKRAEADRIAPSLYYDPDLFEAELEHIFYKTWVWVAHESELPKPGDFVTTDIGRQPVIVVRDKTGAVNVLHNRCRHRGATVCEEHKGNAKGFTCPYHSWSYALDGTLRALPYGDGYEGVCEKGDLPLRKLARRHLSGTDLRQLQRSDRTARRLPRRREAVDRSLHEARRGLSDQGQRRAQIQVQGQLEDPAREHDGPVSLPCRAQVVDEVDRRRNRRRDHELHDERRRVLPLARQRSQPCGAGAGNRRSRQGRRRAASRALQRTRRATRAKSTRRKKYGASCAR